MSKKIMERKRRSLKEKLIYIFQLALEINPPEIAERGKKKTAVFVRWSPHCNLISVAIYQGGWKSGCLPEEEYYVYLITDPPKKVDRIIKRLEEIKKTEKEQSKWKAV